MKNFASSLFELWKQLGLNQRVSLAVAALAVAGGMIAVVAWSRRPDYQLLYARLGEKDAAAVIGHLQSQNIPHEVTAGGTAVQVPADRVYKLRMELAGKGLPTGEGVGFEIFDKGQFGLSDFVQRTNYLRALQGELARTIAQLQGVRAARVMIVQPENRLLLTDQGVKSTASVFVEMGGARLESDQVNAIRHLVANAVQGLAPDQVAVVDSRGNMLSEALKQDPMLGTASSQMRYRQQVEEYLARKVETMLSVVIGAGNAVVRVSAEIETEAATQVSEKFDPEGQVVRSQTTNDDTTASTESRTAGGAAGVSANIPEKQGAAETARPVSSSEQSRKNRTTTYEINRTTSNITRTPGAVKHVSAAVFIAPREETKPAAPAAPGVPAGAPAPTKRSPQEIDALRQIVINALGIKAAPGQSIDSLVTLQEVPFHGGLAVTAGTGAVPVENRVADAFALASRWTGIAGACVVLLIFWRMLSRQKLEPVPIDVLSPEKAPRVLPGSGAVTPELLNEMIRQRPANVGVALRDWVAAGGGGPAGEN